MAEKIKLFELNIDVDAAIKSTAKLRDSADVLKLEYDKLRKSSASSTEEVVKARGAYDNANTEYKSAQKEVQKLTNLKGKEITTVEQGRVALSVLNKEWAKQASLYGENSKGAEELAQKTKQTRERLKELEGGLGDNTRNVGNYTNSFKDAIQQSGLFGQAQGVVNNVTSAGGPLMMFLSTSLKAVKTDYQKAQVNTAGFTKAQIAANVASAALSGGLKILRLALIATGIGAIVVVLGTLITYFASTQEGINKVNMVLTPLKELFGEMKGAIEQTGKALSDLFSGGTFKAFFKDMGDAGDKVSKSFDAAWKRGKEIETLKQNLSKTEADYITLQAKLRKEFEQQNKLADDQTQSTAIREAAAERAIAAQAELSAGTIERVKQEGEILRLKMLSNDTSDEERAALATKLAEIDQALQEEASKTKEAQNKLNSIAKTANTERAAERKAAADAAIKNAEAATAAAIKESSTRLQIFIEENKGKAASLEEGLSFEEQLRDKKLALLKDELAAKKLTQSEFDLASLQTKNGYLEQESALVTEYANKEIEKEKERLAARKEIEAIEKERKATDLENRMAIEAENYLGSLDVEKERLRIQQQLELENAEKTGADKALINKKYAEIDKDIESEKSQFKLSVASDTLGSLVDILGKESAAGKAAAIAQATIETYKSATSAYSAMAGIPVVGPALGAIAAAAAVAAGLKTVQKITSTEKPKIPKAAKGITLEGKSHNAGGETLYNSSGSPMVEAEGGENIYVVNKKASGLINSLSNINQMTGGDALSKSTRYAAAGGMIKKSVNSGINYDTLTSSLMQALSSMPAPRVAVTEINDGQGKYAEIKEGSIF